MVAKLINLLALSTLAIFASSFGNTQVNALSLNSHHARSPVNHAIMAKKRANGDRPKCKPRPSSSAAPSPTGAAPSGSTPSGSPPAQQPSGSPAPSPTPAPAPPASSGGKGLLSWGAGSRPDLLANLHVASKVYNWSPYPVDGAQEAGYEFVPHFARAGDADAIGAIKPGQYRNMLGFNEPDHQDQANIDPGYACQLWKQYMLPLKAGGTRLISPAVTNGPSGKQWMDAFLGACGGIQGAGIDAMAVHVYATDPDYVINYISSWQSYGVPLWVTEFACMDFSGQGIYPSNDDLYAFASKVGSFLKNSPFIEVYAPFMIADSLGNVDIRNKIIDGSSLNALGATYYN